MESVITMKKNIILPLLIAILAIVPILSSCSKENIPTSSQTAHPTQAITPDPTTQPTPEETPPPTPTPTLAPTPTRTITQTEQTYAELLSSHIDDKPTLEAFLSVLSGERDFLGEENLPYIWQQPEDVREPIASKTTSYNIKTFWNGHKSWDGAKIEFDKFAMVHLDEARTPAIILCSNNLYDMLILYYYDGDIYGSHVFTWFYTPIRKNGILHGLVQSSVEELGDDAVPRYEVRFSKITLNDGNFEIIILAHATDYDFIIADSKSEAEEYYLLYYIGDTLVTEEEFKDFRALHDGEDVDFYAFSTDLSLPASPFIRER